MTVVVLVLALLLHVTRTKGFKMAPYTQTFTIFSGNIYKTCKLSLTNEAEVPNILKQFKEGTVSKPSNSTAQTMATLAKRPLTKRLLKRNKFNGVWVEEKDDGQVQASDTINSDDDSNNYSDNLAGNTSVITLSPSVPESYQNSVIDIITSHIKKQGLYMYKLQWLSGRVEVTVSKNPLDNTEEGALGPDLSILSGLHRQLYKEFELHDDKYDFVNRFELIIASPGIGEYLASNLDFLTFRGFNIEVHMKEEYKKKTSWVGTLKDRDETHINISLKGRIVKIPRALVREVTMPTAKTETTDLEMKKLR
jgi:ribosome maturation factor RimP